MSACVRRWKVGMAQLWGSVQRMRLLGETTAVAPIVIEAVEGITDSRGMLICCPEVWAI